MSHYLAELNAMKRWEDNEIETANRLSWTRTPSRERERYAHIAHQKAIVLEKCLLIAAICVQNKLPCGQPPWMARKIASYF